MRNLYRLQKLDGGGYAPASREHVNSLIEKECAEWIGTDYDERLDAVVHYADRVER